MAKRIQIQLYNAKTGESLTLPLNPETTDLENAKDIKTVNILNYGEVSVKGSKLLQRLNLANILPDDRTFLASLASLVQGLDYKPYNLMDTIDMINRWVDNDEIIRVIVSDRLNKEFRVERYIDSVKESVRDSGYSIDLVEYRNPTEKKENILEDNKFIKLKKRTINRFIPNEKIMNAGMTAYKLCKLNYGGKYDEFAKLNKINNLNANLGGQIMEMLPL